MPAKENCQPPEKFPSDYCQKLKDGISRLRISIQSQYEEMFPTGRDWIDRAVQEAEQDAYATPFPSIFFPTLVHLKVREMMPAA